MSENIETICLVSRGQNHNVNMEVACWMSRVNNADVTLWQTGNRARFCALLRDSVTKEMCMKCC